MDYNVAVHLMRILVCLHVMCNSYWYVTASVFMCIIIYFVWLVAYILQKHYERPVWLMYIVYWYSPVL